MMCIATFMIQLDVTIVNVALPRIASGLNSSSAELEWIVGAYALSLAALIPVGGALGDRYGRKRVFLAGMIIFILGSIACALAPTVGLLIAARALQGIGGAAMLALTLSIITESFPAVARGRAIGTWAAVGGTGFGVGPATGGLLLTYFGWSSVFWVNVPFGIVGTLGTAWLVLESRNSHTQRLDALGVSLSASGLVASAFGLTAVGSHPWGSLTVLAPLTLGVVLLAAFAIWERHTPYAMVPAQLLSARSFTVATAVYLISYMALSTTLFYVSLLFQDVMGWSVLQTGFSWLLMNAPFLVAAYLTGRIERQVAPTVVIGSGCIIGVVGLTALAAAGPASPFILAAVGYVLSGAGFGTLVPALSHLAMRDVPSGVTGTASAVLNASRQIGTSLGLAVLGTIGMSAIISNWRTRVEHFPVPVRGTASDLARQVSGGQVHAVVDALGANYRHPAAQAFAFGYHVAFGCAAGCLLLAAVISVLGLRQRPLRTGYASAPTAPSEP